MWSVFGVSVQGAAHRRSGAPNQDAIDWQATYGNNQPLLVLAVADGHGSAHFVRSEIGATIAVRVARALLRDLGEDYYHTGDAVASKHFIDQHLATLLVRGWRKLVADHWAATPLTAAELARLDEPLRARLDADPIDSTVRRWWLPS